MGWLASLTLKDEGRQDLSIPRVVCEYEDIFPDELPGLPSHMDVDFVIELYLGTSPISMTRLTWKGVKFEWDDLYEKTFQELKGRLTSAPILIVTEQG